MQAVPLVNAQFLCDTVCDRVGDIVGCVNHGVFGVVDDVVEEVWKDGVVWDHSTIRDVVFD